MIGSNAPQYVRTMPQYETEAVLRARVAELECVDMHEGWNTCAISSNTDTASMTVERGTEQKTLIGKYLVGCDGSNSKVRQMSGITETCEDHDRLMVLIVFESPAFFDLISQFPNKQFYNVIHPDLDGYWMFFGMVEWGKSFFFHAPVPADTNRENFDFTALIHRAVGKDIPLELSYVGFWDLRISCADTYRNGRIFIAGDAAHSHPPYGGYGINTGFEDSRNLGWKLAATLQGWGGKELLNSYEEERRPVFQSTARDFIGKFIEDDRAFVRAHDPRKDQDAFELAWKKRAEGGDSIGVDTFAPHYEGSSLILGDGQTTSAVGVHDFEARPGRHLPPIKLADGRWTTDHLGEDFTLFCAVGSGQEFLDAAEELGILLSVADLLTEDAIKTYSANAILVRPDGFVSWTDDWTADPHTVLRKAVAA